MNALPAIDNQHGTYGNIDIIKDFILGPVIPFIDQDMYVAQPYDNFLVQNTVSKEIKSPVESFDLSAFENANTFMDDMSVNSAATAQWQVYGTGEDMGVSPPYYHINEPSSPRSQLSGSKSSDCGPTCSMMEVEAIPCIMTEDRFRKQKRREQNRTAQKAYRRRRNESLREAGYEIERLKRELDMSQKNNAELSRLIGSLRMRNRR